MVPPQLRRRTEDTRQPWMPDNGGVRQGLVGSAPSLFPALRRVVHRGRRPPSQHPAALWTHSFPLLVSVIALGRSITGPPPDGIHPEKKRITGQSSRASLVANIPAESWTTAASIAVASVGVANTSVL